MFSALFNRISNKNRAPNQQLEVSTLQIEQNGDREVDAAKSNIEDEKNNDGGESSSSGEES